MFKVISGFCEEVNGTSRVGEIEVVYKDLVAAFGEPGESDGHKVSGEWCFVNSETGEAYTLYDWKSTCLYDDMLPSVERFRANPRPQWFNIGGNGRGDVKEFKRMMLAHIKWIKMHKPFEDAILGSSDQQLMFVQVKK